MKRTIVVNPKYEALRSFLEALPGRFELEGIYIYGGRRNLIKSFVAPQGPELNVKRYQKPYGPNLLVYSWGLRKPKGQRAYSYAGILLDKGISTPEPVAYIEEREHGLLQDSYFVSVQCPYPHRLYEMGNAPAEAYEPMAEALAQYTAQMHDKEVLHLDFSPGNILWEKDDSGYYFTIVDINRMYFGKVSLQQGCTSFARLWGPKRFIQLLARQYAEDRGLDPDEAERITLAARRKFWKHYMKKRELEFPLEL
jgi:hypothetical protein